MKSSFLFLALAPFIVVSSASALTLKSGEVLSSDGKVYSGASPDQKAAIVAQSKSTGLFGAGGKKASTASIISPWHRDINAPV